MNPFDRVDAAFAAQLGALPPITPPVSLADAEAQHEAVNGLFAEESNDEQ